MGESLISETTNRLIQIETPKQPNKTDLVNLLLSIARPKSTASEKPNYSKTFLESLFMSAGEVLTINLLKRVG